MCHKKGPISQFSVLCLAMGREKQHYPGPRDVTLMEVTCPLNKKRTVGNVYTNNIEKCVFLPKCFHSAHHIYELYSLFLN